MANNVLRVVLWPLRVLCFALYLVLGCIFGFDGLEEM